MTNYFDFANQTYLVTGASSGLGRAVTKLLDECNANVILTGQNEQRLEKTADTLKNRSRHHIFAKNLLDDGYEDLFDVIAKNVGKLSGIVHCAGISPVLPINSLTRDAIDECTTVNFFSLVELVRLFSKRKYRAEKGSIVAVSSISSLYPDKCQTVYAASKAALNAAVQGMALELVRNDVRINAVLPGSMDTEMTNRARNEMGSENFERKLSKQILGLTRTEDVANVILFLLSDMSAVITGRLIPADGGYINF